MKGDSPMDAKEIAALFEANRRLTVSKTSSTTKVEVYVGGIRFEDSCTAYGLIPYVKKLFTQLDECNSSVRLQLQLNKDTANIVAFPY